ncbi:MAG: sulfotransferase [Gemmatimonadaceae bacterium]
MRERRHAPVFVCGFPRSGTTLLYHMLLSSGNFAYYRTETWVFDMIVPRFGDLRRLETKERLLRLWLQSSFFRLSGLDPDGFRQRVLAECQDGGDFLEILMGSIAASQGVERWAECTPTHLLYIPEIKRTIPDALFVHMIRDGRDAALSYEKQGWVHPLPGDRQHTLLVAGLYWEWMIRRGRALGQTIPTDYTEVRFEDLIARPRETLSRIGEFIEHDLDYDKIQSVAIGSVTKPNTSFSAPDSEGFNPVGRWRNLFSPDKAQAFEALVGPFLRELGYDLTTRDERPGLTQRRLRATYPAYFAARHWLKASTPLGKFLVNIDFLRDKNVR